MHLNPPYQGLPDRFVSAKERRAMIPFSDMHYSRKEKEGLVPARIRIGPNRVVWRLSELLAYIEKKTAERDAAVGLAEPDTKEAGEPP